MLVKYKTQPKISWYYRLADDILELLAMRFLDVFSHHWHWQNWEYNKTFDNFGIKIKGAPSGNPHNNPFFGVIAHLGGRPYGYVLEAEYAKKGYFLAFKHPGTDHFRRCNIKLTTPVMLLSGPDNGCTVFAMDENNNPLKLKILSELIHRKDKPREVRIL